MKQILIRAKLNEIFRFSHPREKNYRFLSALPIIYYKKEAIVIYHKKKLSQLDSKTNHFGDEKTNSMIKLKNNTEK